MTTKASKDIPVPSNPVITISLTNPSILDTKVQKLTRPLLAKSLIDFLLFTILAGSGFSLKLLLF